MMPKQENILQAIIEALAAGFGKLAKRPVTIKVDLPKQPPPVTNVTIAPEQEARREIIRVTERDSEGLIKTLEKISTPESATQISPKPKTIAEIVHQPPRFVQRSERTPLPPRRSPLQNLVLRAVHGGVVEVAPISGPGFQSLEIPSGFATHAEMVDRLQPSAEKALRAILQSRFDPAEIQAQAHDLSEARKAWGNTVHLSAIYDALDAAAARLQISEAVSGQDVDRALALLRESVRHHFGGTFKPADAPTINALMAESFTSRAKRHTRARPPEPERTAAEVLKSITLGGGPYDGYYDKIHALLRPSKLRAMVRHSVGLDRQDRNPMRVDPWAAAPVPYLGAFPADPAPRQSVLNTALSLTQSDRPNGLRFTTRAAEFLYDESLKQPQGVPVLGDLGDPVLAAQQRTIRARLLGMAREAIAETGHDIDDWEPES